MMCQSTILVILAAIASAQAGVIGHQAFVAPYASSYNAHHINHAVAHPLIAPAPVPLAVHHHAPAVFAAPAPVPAPAFLPGPIPAPALLAAPAPAFLPGAPAPAFLNAPAPFAYSAGLPANYNLW